MPKVDFSELTATRARYFKNLKSCLSVANSLLEGGSFVDFVDHFGYASWYLEKIKAIDFQVGCVSVDVENNSEK